VKSVQQRVSIHTLGCKLNAVESSAVLQSFVDAGYAVVPFGTPADVVVVNTCTVTEQANTEGRHLIRSATSTSPQATLAVTGCYAQLQPQAVAALPGVRVVAGAAAKSNLVALVQQSQRESTQVVDVNPTHDAMEYQPAQYDADGRTRAFLKVQDGCDYVCTFCTIPQARGASRSMAFADVVRQLASFHRAGFAEIVITGVNIGEYRAPTGERLWHVLAAATHAAPSCRIRLGSVEPNTFRQELLDALANNPQVCRHVHVPLQSGSRAILTSMRRRYSPQAYAKVLHSIATAVPLVGIGIDVITGYPGESHEHFEETFAFLDSLPWSYLHVFTYSERANTPAATMANAVPIHERRSRTARLRALSDVRRQRHAHLHLDTTAHVIPESYDADKGHWQGWTDTYQAVRFAAPATRPKQPAHVMCHSVVDTSIVEATLVTEHHK
jgi:threonylcarbamoyladenosine tRNA methylthiotransferase MtaB